MYRVTLSEVFCLAGLSVYALPYKKINFSKTKQKKHTQTNNLKYLMGLLHGVGFEIQENKSVCQFCYQSKLQCVIIESIIAK